MQITKLLVAGQIASQAVSRKILNWLDAPRFFYFLVGLLVFQASWVALSARYPQAFDENFHFGLIGLHAQQWLPFFTSHIPGAEIYGAVSRDPSYLYHYILSFPYRLLLAVTDSLTVQVISLRFLNIALFAGGMFVFRRFLLELGVSRRMMHTVFLFFIITPIVPLLAGQINYDNLIFLLTGLQFLHALRVLKGIRQSNTIRVVDLALVVLYGLVASIVKYTSVPLTLGIVGIIIAMAGRAYWRSRISRSVINWQWPSKIIACTVVLLILLAGILFIERFGINLARYHSPQPDCAKVLSVDQCQSYSPWARDHLFSATYPRPSAWGIFVYPGVWVHRMVFETMFVVSARFTRSDFVEYWAAPPLTVANYTAWTIVVAGGLLTAVFIGRIWRQRYLSLFLLAIVFYTVILFLKNFAMYIHSGEAVAIHGRYLIPMYLVLYLLLAMVIGWGLEKIRRPHLKVWLVLLTCLLLVHGAGLIAWIMRSEREWYWEQPTPALPINTTTKNVLDYFIIK